MTAPVFTGKPKEVVCFIYDINFSPHVNIQTATDGDKVQIECKVTGSPAPEITWFLNKKEIKPSAVS